VTAEQAGQKNCNMKTIMFQWENDNALQSLILPVEIFGFGGLSYTVGKVLKTPFQWCITCPKKSNIVLAYFFY
jgi:hypothetical protein